MHRSDRRPEAVSVLAPDDVPAVVSVLAESFHDYPVMRFVLGETGDYDARLETLITFFVMARALRDETLLGVRGEDGLVATALVSRPGAGPSPASLLELREETWATLGAAERSRYEAFGAATEPFAVAADHLHLNMIGVRPAAQGRGLGRRLLEAVHARSAADAASAGVSLSTELETNVPLYRHFGYEVLGSADVGSAFTT
ncbi:MAG: GNAT family N-acetyltransferase, partial [Gemmatimonadetes bacterium]|nr:GNAT family N-acetyltransferase [Gemmatimonadota bacterium]NIR35445.1 GNAT family N-acetyltransferase [Actinomycetota bacterium]NIU73124.1 GNAT family N-acetyltransferase [Gammaproteobacteria bacterium]NIQ52980.1 GNAT family N-acetyltransferase [Gemmatimonadota bacterium]NIX43429.1 GNAT family N-acetyltransferase [Gemmatimonadota bacterium]